MILINLLSPRPMEFNPALWGNPMKDRDKLFSRTRFASDNRYTVNSHNHLHCSENRTKQTPTLSLVTSRDTLPIPPSGPSLSYSPIGLDNPVSESVLAYLAGAESREPQAWLRDDIRISWLTVLHCAEGIADPWRFAFWKYLGATPEKIIPQLIARAEAHRLMEVPDYDPTVKHAQPVRIERKEKSA